MAEIGILGNGVAANLAAAYFRKTFPDLGVAVIGRNPPRRPIVGESLVEVSTLFIRELGLGPLLIERHHPKYGLTYYYKQKLEDPSDRRYVVDEAPALPPFPSFEVNRFTFDRDLRACNAAAGVTQLEDRIVDVEIVKGAHRVLSEAVDGSKRETVCRWLVDATGRSRVLGRRLGLHIRPALQKDVFWFWLVDFDPALLSRIDAVKKENRSFDSYYCTHHFFGRGSWIWCIPIVAEDRRPMISIGITYRKDLHPREIRSLADFLEQVGAEHPVVTDLVRSGSVRETNFYGSYMYEATRRYSPDGWFLLGDAADTVDPLYSLGLALTSLQVRQIGAAIAEERRGAPTADFVADLDIAFENAHHLATHEITDLYRVMHDPWRCHMRMHLAILAMFHLAVPLSMSGYMWDPAGVKIFNGLMRREALAAELGRLAALVDAAAPARPGYLKVQSVFSLNHRFFEHVRETDIPRSLAALCLYLAALRLSLLRRLGPRGLVAVRHQGAALRDLARAAALRALFQGARLKESRIARRVLAEPPKARRAAARRGVLDRPAFRPSPEAS